MKALIWSLTVLLAALWTVFVALAHQLTGWLLSAIDAGTVAQVASTVGDAPLPPLPDWLSPWLDTAWLGTMQAFAVDLVQWLGSVLPSGDTLMVWIGPLLWVVWGMGLLTLLAVAGLLHWLAGRVPGPGKLRSASA